MLAQPLNQGEQAAANSLGQDGERKRSERVRAPHRAHDGRQREPEPTVEADRFVRPLGSLRQLPCGDVRVLLFVEFLILTVLPDPRYGYRQQFFSA